ncbi:MAG: TIGR01458 family HAD-type hydrolase [Methanoregula sp.]|nr:MAG: TIGR01458 family HAD-type hydrolase [Methanoregula sp.]
MVTGMDVKGFLIDLDGVLYTGEQVIDGARMAIGLLAERKYRFRFVSNTTRSCKKTISGRLARLGFDIPEPSIFTPPFAAIARMNALGKHRCMLITTGDVHKDFENSCDIHGEGAIDYVVVGDAGDAISYERLNAAFRAVNAGAEIIALEKDRYWMSPDGLMLSAGPFVAALEYATGKTATVMGKPSPVFFEMALRDIGLDPCEAAMIGDDILTDIAGARAIGMKTVLVRTGKFNEGALLNAPVRPDYVIGSIADIRDLL